MILQGTEYSLTDLRFVETSLPHNPCNQFDSYFLHRICRGHTDYIQMLLENVHIPHKNKFPGASKEQRPFALHSLQILVSQENMRQWSLVGTFPMDMEHTVRFQQNIFQKDNPRIHFGLQLL